MAEAAASILPNKLGQAASAGKDSVFPPGFLDKFADTLGEAVRALVGCRVIPGIAQTDQITATAMAQDVEEHTLAAMLTLNGTTNAACTHAQPTLIFHLVDLMMGADPDSKTDHIAREPSALDRECAALLGTTVAEAFARTLVATQAVEDSAGSCSRVEADMDKTSIAPRTAEVFSVDISLSLGRSERSGIVRFFIARKTLDGIFLNSNDTSGFKVSPNDPWFRHMKETVLDIGLDTLAVLHVEEMNVAALSRMDVGDLITLPEEAVQSTRLILNGQDEILAEGELGASLGRRALRLHVAPDPKFLNPMFNLVACEETIEN